MSFIFRFCCSVVLLLLLLLLFVHLMLPTSNVPAPSGCAQSYESISLSLSLSAVAVAAAGMLLPDQRVEGLYHPKVINLSSVAHPARKRNSFVGRLYLFILFQDWSACDHGTN